MVHCRHRLDDRSRDERLRDLADRLLAHPSVVLAGWLATFSQIATHVSDVFGGTVVDRHNRKGLIIANAVFGTLLWGTVFVLIALHAIAFPIFAIVTVAASAVNGLLANATNAMLRTIIPTREYPKAQSLNQGRDSVVSIAGSPLGGVLYAVAPWLPFAVASLMYGDQRCQCRPAARRRTCPRHGDDRSQEQAPRHRVASRLHVRCRRRAPTPMRQQSRRTPRSSRISSKDGAGRCAGTRCWRSA